MAPQLCRKAEEMPLTVTSAILLLLPIAVYYRYSKRKQATSPEPDSPQNDGFSYQSLNQSTSKGQIRLIHLLSGNISTPLQCRLGHVSLEENPTFYALSYRWTGPPTQIICNGQPLWVTQNLSSAIQTLSKQKISPIWADAISINQNDDVEKTAQVKLMFDIYSQATETIVWLGPGSEERDAAMNLIEELAKISRGYIDTKEGGNLFQYPEIPHDDVQRILRTHEAVLPLVQGLLSNDYFTRTWMIQEFLAASKLRICCGGRVLAGGQLWDASKLLLEAGSSATGLAGSLVASRAYYRFMHHLSKPPKTLTILQDNDQRSATDPRDKLFSISHLGIDSESIIQVNYSPSHTAAKAYLDFARAVIRENRDLRILCIPKTMTGITVPDLPSWVPDWSGEPRSERIINSQAVASVLESQYHASGEDRYDILPFNDLEEIVVEAQFLDDIKEMGKYLHVNIQWKMFSWHALSVLSSWIQISRLDEDKDYVAGGSIFDAFWQTLLADDNPPKPEREYDEEMKRDCETVLQAVKMTQRRSVYMPLESWGSQCTLFKAGIERLVANVKRDIWRLSWKYGRCLCRSEMGYLLLANGHVRVGDMVFLVKGCPSPVIFRRGDGHWNFVSDAYVHGVMKGEAYENARVERIILK